MDRRKFCVSSAAFAAATAAGLHFRTAIDEIGDSPPESRVTLYKVIFDARFPASRAFGMAAAGVGRTTAAIRGDVTSLWFGDLRLQWADSRGAIAGMTTQPSFFCLQQLAKDHWMRVLVSSVPQGSDDDACARRIRRIVGTREGERILAADPKLVSWVIAA